MISHQVITFSTLLLPALTAAFSLRPKRQQRLSALDLANVGIFFGTSTGTTEVVGEIIKEEFGNDADGPFDVESLEGSVEDNFKKYDALIVGTPTWNTGADTERSGTHWDELYSNTLLDLKIGNKNVAVFGCGDQISYAENFADATGELHDVFKGMGAKIFGYTSQEGYEHVESKSIRGDKFCGLLCDAVNQEDLTEIRVKNWVSQLKTEGFMELSSPSPITITPKEDDNILELAVEKEEENVFQNIDENSEMLDQTIGGGVTNTGFKSYYNSKTKTTMFVSADGRSCYYTADPKTSFSP